MGSGYAGPVLIDTSLWIGALRRSGPAEARREVGQAVEVGMALVNGLILTELLRGTRDHDERERLELLLEAVTCLPTGPPVFRRAGVIGVELREAGVTVPTIDLLIAASAIEAGVPLLHDDAHYPMIAAHTGLEERTIG